MVATVRVPVRSILITSIAAAVNVPVTVPEVRVSRELSTVKIPVTRRDVPVSPVNLPSEAVD